jgi:hypothetical protein
LLAFARICRVAVREKRREILRSAALNTAKAPLAGDFRSEERDAGKREPRLRLRMTVGCSGRGRGCVDDAGCVGVGIRTAKSGCATKCWKTSGLRTCASAKAPLAEGFRSKRTRRRPELQCELHSQTRGDYFAGVAGVPGMTGVAGVAGVPGMICLFWIETNSISKIRAELGPITFPAPRSP